MRNKYLKWILIAVLVGCSEPRPSAQTDSEYQLPNRADISEAAAVMPAVNSYYSVLRLSSEIDPILLKAAAGNQFSEADQSEFSAHISKAKSLLSSASLESASLPPVPSELSGDELVQASRVRNLLPQLETAAMSRVSGWEKQFLALQNRDQQTYEALLKDEVDTSILLIEAANTIGRARLSGVDPAAPAYHVQDAIVLGNDTVIAFLKFADQFETRGLGNDNDISSEMEGLLSDIEATISRGEMKISSVRQQVREMAESRSTQSLLDVMDCVQSSLDNEKKVLDELRVYHAAAVSLASGAFDEPEQRRLQSAETEFATLSTVRSGLKFRCYELGIAFQEAASSQ